MLVINTYIHKPWYQKWHHACYYLKHKVNNEQVGIYLYTKHVGLFIILFGPVVQTMLEIQGLCILKQNITGLIN